jgi:hypothetical protein
MTSAADGDLGIGAADVVGACGVGAGAMSAPGAATLGTRDSDDALGPAPPTRAGVGLLPPHAAATVSPTRAFTTTGPNMGLGE